MATNFNKLNAAGSGWVEDFKKFALKGNVVDLAVGVIIGAAFSGLVTSAVDDIFMPVLGRITGGFDFSNLFWQMAGAKQVTLDAARKAGATLAYGNFLTKLVNFLIVAFVLYLIIKGLNKLELAGDKKAKDAAAQTNDLLTEIRNMIRKKSPGAGSSAAKAIKPMRRM